MLAFGGQQMCLPCDVFEMLVTYKDKVRPLVPNRGLKTPTEQVFISYNSGIPVTQNHLSNILTSEMKGIEGGSRVTATKFRKSFATLVRNIYTCMLIYYMNHYLHSFKSVLICYEPNLLEFFIEEKHISKTFIR